MKKFLVLSIELIVFSFYTWGQTRVNYRLPDIPGYITLKGDFHMHTPFSDGTVWPTDRVMEAWRDGLDVIAITDHLEYNPNKKDINPDLNRPYEIAKPLADKFGIILIKAAEITRGMPPGHFNAYFIEDANALKKKEVKDVFQVAKEQGAFFNWNHPGWKAQQPDTTIWFPLHTEFFEKGWLNGIEVSNDKEYYPIVHKWANEKSLAVFANSDVHGPIDFDFQPSKYEHRPMTIVFVKERTQEGIREAFFSRRTLACFKDTLLGSEEYLKPLIQECIEVQNSYYLVNSKSEMNVILTNLSDFPLNLSGISTEAFSIPKSVYLDGNSSVSISVKNLHKLESGENEVKIGFKVLNALTAPNTPLVIEQKVNAFYWKAPDLIQTDENKWKIKFENASDKIAYYYSINAENPTEKSPGINEPFIAKDSVILMLAAYKDTKRVGEYYKETFMLHRGIGQEAILANNPSKKYFGFGAKSLTDGLIGSNTHNDGNWIGFEQNNLEAMIEFDKPANIQSIETNFFENTFYWIFLPKSLTVYTSTDGINYKEYGKQNFADPKDGITRGLVNVRIKKKSSKVKYIKFIAVNQGSCPGWHPGKGKPAWLFNDEIIIK